MKKEPNIPKPLHEVLKPLSGFEVGRKGKLLSYLTVNGRVFVLNHHDKPLLGAKGLHYSPPTQEELKMVYDSNPMNATFVKAPKGYEAEWSKFQ